MAAIKKIKDVVDRIYAWSQAICDARLNGGYSRKWCLLDYEGSLSDQEAIRAHFDREKLNQAFKKQYEEIHKKGNEVSAITAERYSVYQKEIHLIYGCTKSVIARHKTRLQHYRDDLSNKKVRIPLSLRKGLTQFAHIERSNDNTSPTPSAAMLPAAVTSPTGTVAA